MERVAGDVEGSHLGVADLDAFLVGALVEHALDLEALVVVAPINSTTASRSVRGRPRLASAPGTARLPAFRQRPGVDIVLAAVDRGARKPRDLRHHREPTPARGTHLRRCKQAPAALIEMATHRLPAIPDGVLVDHATDLRLFASFGNPRVLSQTDAAH